MAVLRTLTVNLVDLNLQTSVIDGAQVEISLERAVSADSFSVVPTLSYKKASDDTGVLTFRLLANDDTTKYRARVTSAAGQNVLDAFFVMPNANSDLAPLLKLHVYPDGFNEPESTSVIQIQVNGQDTGPATDTITINFAGSSLSGTSAENLVTVSSSAVSYASQDLTSPQKTQAKTNLDLQNVDNTSDANKPVSTAQQEALNAKQATITGAATTITSTDLAASRAVVSDASGKIAASSTTTAAEIEYVHGVTSAIQTQLSGKEPTISSGTTSQYYRGDKTWQTLDGSAVGLGSVTNAAQFAKSGDTLTGTAGSGYFGAIKQSAKPSAPTDGYRMYADASGRLSWIGESGYIRTFDGTANTADRVYTLPDTAGTIALTGESYPRYTWAGKPAANSVAAGCRITITDFLEEVDFYSNGTRWLSVGHGPVTLAVDPTSSSVGSTTAETTLKTVNVPVDLLGPTGIIEVDTGWACNSGNTNSKTGRIRIGTTVAGTAVLAQNLNATTTQSASARTIVWADNSTAAQKATPNSFGSGNATPAIVSTTVDTAAAFSIYLTGTKANSADTLSLEVCRIRIYPGA